MDEIEYRIVPEHQCARIKPLWIALRTHIRMKNPGFFDHIQKLSFKERMDEIKKQIRRGKFQNRDRTGYCPWN